MTRFLTGAVLAALAVTAAAQDVDPDEIISDPSEACGGGEESHTVCITLPPDSTFGSVDVFLLFDDTGSFAGTVSALVSVFQSIVTDLQTALPGVDFAFGVGRFEDYGGPGTGFSGETADGRPFTLNQALITTDTPNFTMLINDALARTAPGFGGDGPESAIGEGLWQCATGLGFDGDGNGSTLDSGPAGDPLTQTNPGTSGDVPPWSSHVGVTSGSLGGVGFRPDALHLVLLATDVCAVSAFDFASGIPATVSGTGGTEPVSAFACSSTTPGDSRFGYVSDSKSAPGGIPGAVVPSGAGTVPDTIAALNALGIRVIGLGPGAGPTSSAGPGFDESIFLSALARLTGAVGSLGDPLVFDIFGGSAAVAAAIVAAVLETSIEPVDIILTADPPCAGLTVSATPPVHPDVGPGDTVCFDVTFTGDASFMGCGFDLNFRDQLSFATIGTIPVTLRCEECLLILGNGFGAEPYAFTSHTHTFVTQLRDIYSAHLVTMVHTPLIPVWNGGGGAHGRALRPSGWADFYAQVLMYNPNRFPTNPEQFSKALRVLVSPTGQTREQYWGSRDGIDIWCDLVRISGGLFLTFPFSIDGM